MGCAAGGRASFSLEARRSRCLRVIKLADKVTILNAFPDRGFKP